MLKPSLSTVLIALFILSTYCLEEPKPDQIIEVFRHGARGPVYPGYDDSWPSTQDGVLTSTGMRQQYILGKVLAEKYPELIGKAYDYNQIYMLSDTTPRCIQSALAHLYGMYMGTGPSLKDNYPPELAIPPFKDARVKSIADSLPDYEALPFNFIPNIVNIVDTSNAYIFQGDWTPYCPNEPTWENENANDTRAQKAWEIFGETIANVNKHLNASQQILTADDMASYGDTLLVDIYDNRTLPGGIEDPELIRNMTYAFAWFTFHVWGGQQIQRELLGFTLINSILEQLAAFKEGKTHNTVALFSGHDDNIFAILNAFGVVNEDCLLANFLSELKNETTPYPNCNYPFFASDIIVEFYNDTNTPYVKFYYNNALIPLCNGQPACSYDDFVVFANNVTGNNTLSSYFQKCGANDTDLAGLGIKNLQTTILDNKVQTISGRIGVRTEIMIISGLILLCFVLGLRIVADKKRYNQSMKQLRQERMLLTQINEVDIY